MINFHFFFKYIYELVFPHSKLAEKPKPWRTSLILEIVYGGWTLIRSQIKTKFSKCKHPLYAIFLNLLDSYIPLVLSIYSITYRSNNFAEYFLAIKFAWIMFYCFKRRHYDKATLIWLSNILHWKNDNFDMFNCFRNFLNISDEYGVENAHSIIRAQTKDGDDPSTLKRKAMAVFQSKKSQHNFRSSFTPPKKSSFSHNQLKSLKLSAATHLTKMFSRISSLSFSPNFEDNPLDNMLKAFYSTDTKINSFPFGYHTEWKPNPNRFCDLPACNLQEADEEWAMIEGCGHSYHIRCLNDVTYCPICRAYIKKEIERLSTSIINGINSNQIKDLPTVQLNASEIVEERYDTSDLDAEDIKFCEVLRNDIDKLTESIESFQPQSPHDKSATVFTPFHREKKPPHCKKCGHAKKGHKKANQGGLECCLFCQGGTCSIAGKTATCNCDWHTNPPKEFKGKGKNVHKDRKSNTTKLGHITEHLLPPEASQVGVKGYGTGSNSCTAISVLTCKATLKQSFLSPSVTDDVDELIGRYCGIIAEGNILYEFVNSSDDSPNLMVEEVLENSDVEVYMPHPMIPILNREHLVTNLKSLLETTSNLGCVLIVYPDKAMSLCVYDDRIWVFDSHRHLDRGALIASTSQDYIDDFCKYLDTVCKRFYGYGVEGSNLVYLEPYKK